MAVKLALGVRMAKTDVVHPRLDGEGHPQHDRAQNGLHRDDPRPSAPDRRDEPRVDDRRPEEFERIRIAGQREYGDLRIREALS